MDLYVLADKYMQKELADLCEDFLTNNVGLNNFEKMNEFAEMYDAELLTKTISELVERNPLEFPNLGSVFSLGDED